MPPFNAGQLRAHISVTRIFSNRTNLIIICYQVIARTHTGSVGDELHHSGWNVCSSCHDDPSLKRDLLILPALKSAKVFIVDVGTDPRKPKMHKVSNVLIYFSFYYKYLKSFTISHVDTLL